MIARTASGNVTDLPASVARPAGPASDGTPRVSRVRGHRAAPRTPDARGGSLSQLAHPGAERSRCRSPGGPAYASGRHTAPPRLAPPRVRVDRCFSRYGGERFAGSTGNVAGLGYTALAADAVPRPADPELMDDRARAVIPAGSGLGPSFPLPRSLPPARTGE